MDPKDSSAFLRRLAYTLSRLTGNDQVAAQLCSIAHEFDARNEDKEMLDWLEKSGYWITDMDGGLEIKAERVAIRAAWKK